MEFVGGMIVRLTSATGIGSRRYRLERDGREHFALRDENGTCRTKRYTAAELDAKCAAGLLTTEDSH